LKDDILLAVLGLVEDFKNSIWRGFASDRRDELIEIGIAIEIDIGSIGENLDNDPDPDPDFDPDFHWARACCTVRT
jgi:hypothetical protein